MTIIFKMYSPVSKTSLNNLPSKFKLLEQSNNDKKKSNTNFIKKKESNSFKTFSKNKKKPETFTVLVDKTKKPDSFTVLIDKSKNLEIEKESNLKLEIQKTKEKEKEKEQIEPNEKKSENMDIESSSDDDDDDDNNNILDDNNKKPKSDTQMKDSLNTVICETHIKPINNSNPPVSNSTIEKTKKISEESTLDKIIPSSPDIPASQNNKTMKKKEKTSVISEKKLQKIKLKAKKQKVSKKKIVKKNTKNPSSVSGTLRKPHTFRPGSRVISSIKKQQNSTELQIPNLSLIRVIREIAQDINPNTRFQKSAFYAIRTIIEQDIIKTLNISYNCFAGPIGKRKTLMKRDIESYLKTCELISY